jgi:alanine-glyoxylate transaminase/serine-glyoxylate transaminase/serine-pyruvate transaminase
MPDRVLQAMHIPSPNIYEGEVVDMTDQILLDLCECSQTTVGTAIIYIGNGHAAWEAALANTLGEGDRALVVSTGTFATAWGVIAESVGVVVETLEFGMLHAADPAVLTEYLSRPESAGIKAVMVCQTDTASSCTNDVGALRAAIDAAGHPALYMVDCVASFVCEEMHMDECVLQLE